MTRFASDYNSFAMADSLSINYDFSLQTHNTFGIAAKAHAYLRITQPDVLLHVKKIAALEGLPRLILGGGSNILFTGDFPGLVLHMGLQGIHIVHEDEHTTYICAAAGENWHGLVRWTLLHGLSGLENLSLIPGTVGAAPVQNIGAYGVEIQDCFHELTAFDFETGQLLTLSKKDCAFGYRDSVFKHQLHDRVVILNVTLALPKQWQPRIGYAELEQELAARSLATPTALDVSDTVVAIRMRKLPDPALIGNAGSFFKNPIVSAKERDALLMRYPQLVSYAQQDGNYKLAAGWLIERCGWKGKRVGNAGVYERQSLVLVNYGGATGKNVEQLAYAIQADVMAEYGVMLEPEPVFISAS